MGRRALTPHREAGRAARQARRGIGRFAAGRKRRMPIAVRRDMSRRPAPGSGEVKLLMRSKSSSSVHGTASTALRNSPAITSVQTTSARNKAAAQTHPTVTSVPVKVMKARESSPIQTTHEAATRIRMREGRTEAFKVLRCSTHAKYQDSSELPRTVFYPYAIAEDRGTMISRI